MNLYRYLDPKNNNMLFATYHAFSTYKSTSGRYGFYNWDRIHKYAWTAYPRGAQMTFWIEKAAEHIFAQENGMKKSSHNICFPKMGVSKN